MDAGQSGVRTRLGGVLLPELRGVRTSAPVIPQLAAVARAVLETVDLPVDSLAVGSTALRPGTSADELLAYVADLGVTKVALAHDSVTSHLGALRGRRGAIVAAGTGCVAFAVGTSAVARVDGWGNIVGDAGSGFGIGRTAIDAVLRAHDGRGPETALTEAIEPGFADLEAAYLDIQNDAGYVQRVAAYAKTVADLADTDQVCADIIDQAAAELALSAVTALRRVGEDDSPMTFVAKQGKLFLGQRLSAQFDALVHQAVPSAMAVPPQGDSLDGASQLFGLPEDSPLRAQVSYA